MIAGDHHRADACCFRPRDGLSRLVAGRVDHADEPGEHEVVLDALVDFVVCSARRRKIPVSNAECAQRAAGELLVRSRISAPALRSTAALFAHLLLRAACEQHVGRALW